jgi:NitT/TauT family transport system substrate-binding protein
MLHQMGKFISVCLLAAVLSAGCATAPTSPSISPLATAAESRLTPLSTTNPELTRLKVSILPFLSYAPLFIAQEEGFFKEQGLEVEFVRIDKTSEAMPALAQGQIDVASGFFDVSTLNAVAKGGGIKYVSDKGFLDARGCGASTWVVRKDLVDKLEDLKNIKGLKIALTPTSSAEYALDLLLKDSGLTHKDVEILNLPLPARLDGLSSGAVDIAALSDPWTVRAVKAGGVEWRPWQTYMPDFQFSINMYGPNLLVKNPEIGKRYMLAYLKGARQYNLGKTPRNIEIISKYTQIKPDEVQSSCWMSIRPDGLIKLDDPGLKAFQEWAVANGYQDSLVPPEQMIDLSIVQAANQAQK